MSPAATRTLQALTVGLSAVVVVFCSFTAIAIVGLGTCFGDGGVPFSADDSPAGVFCESGWAETWSTTTLIAPTLVLLVIGVVGVIRRRWLWVGLAAAAGLGALFLLAAPVLGLSGDCSEVDQRAYDAWSAGGQYGPAPADCQTY